MAPHTKTIFDSNMQKIYLINAGCQGLPAPIQHPLSLTICDSVMPSCLSVCSFNFTRCRIKQGTQINNIIDTAYCALNCSWPGLSLIFDVKLKCVNKENNEPSSHRVQS